jgi:hypothetical protein
VFRDVGGMSAIAYAGAREVFINKRLQLLTKKDEPLPKFVPSPELQDALSRTDDED